MARAVILSLGILGVLLNGCSGDAEKGKPRFRSPSSMEQGLSEERTWLLSIPWAMVVGMDSDRLLPVYGCADGVREGFRDFDVFRSVAACAGSWNGSVGSESAGEICAPGWSVCSPDTVSAHSLKDISYQDAMAFGGCFAYDAANDFGGCASCAGTSGQDDMAGVGSECEGGNYTESESSCLADGRIDSKCCDGSDDGGCIQYDWIYGVVCCADGGLNPNPGEAPVNLPGYPGNIPFRSCADGYRVAYYGCDGSLWDQGHGVFCSRDGYYWVCPLGSECDTETPIDFVSDPSSYINWLTTPWNYCVPQGGEPSCPPGFPLDCQSVCCREGATCNIDSCSGGCPADHPVQCSGSTFIPECCLPGASCGFQGCECPADLPQPCGMYCCSANSICVNGECQVPECDDSYPVVCGPFCCLPGAVCADGECGCPAEWPVVCEDTCCESDLMCQDGKCVKPDGNQTECSFKSCWEPECCITGTDEYGCEPEPGNPPPCGDVAEPGGECMTDNSYRPCPVGMHCQVACVGGEFPCTGSFQGVCEYSQFP